MRDYFLQSVVLEVNQYIHPPSGVCLAIGLLIQSCLVNLCLPSIDIRTFLIYTSPAHQYDICLSHLTSHSFDVTTCYSRPRFHGQILRHNSSTEENLPLQPLTSYNVWGDSDLGKVYCSHAALYCWDYQSGMSHFLWSIFGLDIKSKSVALFSICLKYFSNLCIYKGDKTLCTLSFLTGYCLSWHFMTNQYIKCQAVALGHFLRDCLRPAGCMAGGQWGHFEVSDPS